MNDIFDNYTLSSSFTRWSKYLPFKFYLKKLIGEYKQKTIVAQIVFQRPVAKPLKIGGLMGTPYKGLYLVWTPEKKLEEVEREINSLKSQLENLEYKKELLKE